MYLWSPYLNIENIVAPCGCIHLFSGNTGTNVSQLSSMYFKIWPDCRGADRFGLRIGSS